MPKLRVWPALLVTVCALLASVGAAAVAIVPALLALGVFRGGMNIDIPDIMARLLDQPWGSAVLVLPGQLTMLGVTFGATLLSRRPLAARLGYTRSLLPWRMLPLLLVGTLFFGAVGGMLIEWLFPSGPSDALKMMQSMMRKPQGAGLVSLVIMVCVLPPLAEEALFRGYLQRRLLQRWHPVWAIAVSSLFFTTAHFDPQHVLAIVPLAIWLGVVAWRSDSLWPSMLCHCAQNSLALVGTRMGLGESKETSPGEIAVFVVAGALTVWAVMIMRRHPVPGRVVAGSISTPLSNPPAVG